MSKDLTDMCDQELVEHLRALRSQVNSTALSLASRGYRVEVEIKHLTRFGNRYSYPDLDFVVLKQVK